MAAIEVHGVDLAEPTASGEDIDGRLQHAHVDPVVGAVKRPGQRDVVAIDTEGPLPALFGPVRGVRAGPVAAVGGLAQTGVDSHLAEVEPNDPVESSFGFGTGVSERTGFDPLVA